jgi:hypothetical protein
MWDIDTIRILRGGRLPSSPGPGARVSLRKHDPYSLFQTEAYNYS